VRLVSVVLFAGFYALYVLNPGGSNFFCHDLGLGGLLKHFPPMFLMAQCLFIGHGLASRQRLIRWDIWIVVVDVISLIVGLVVGEVLVRYGDSRCKAVQCPGQA